VVGRRGKEIRRRRDYSFRLHARSLTIARHEENTKGQVMGETLYRERSPSYWIGPSVEGLIAGRGGCSICCSSFLEGRLFTVKKSLDKGKNAIRRDTPRKGNAKKCAQRQDNPLEETAVTCRPGSPGIERKIRREKVCDASLMGGSGHGGSQGQVCCTRIGEIKSIRMGTKT